MSRCVRADGAGQAEIEEEREAAEAEAAREEEERARKRALVAAMLADDDSTTSSAPEQRVPSQRGPIDVDSLCDSAATSAASERSAPPARAAAAAASDEYESSGMSLGCIVCMRMGSGRGLYLERAWPTDEREREISLCLFAGLGVSCPTIS